jgi:hypothetical protein
MEDIHLIKSPLDGIQRQSYPDPSIYTHTRAQVWMIIMVTTYTGLVVGNYERAEGIGGRLCSSDP